MFQDLLHVKAVLFDLDGTLVDSELDLAHAVNYMLKELGRGEQPLANVIAWVGNGMPRLVKRALTGEMNAEPDPQLYERGVALFKKFYGANLITHTRPYPG